MLISHLSRIRAYFISLKLAFSKKFQKFDGRSNVRDLVRDGIEDQIHQQLEYFRELTAADVMIPKHDIISVNDVVTLEELYAKFITSSFTRIPVYKDVSDEIVGFVHVKDVLPYVGLMHSDKPMSDFNVQMITRQMMYFSRSTNCIDLLTRMRQGAVQIAAILDEHGGTDGLVMMELLIEKIVGDIRDEHDVDKPRPVLVNRISENEYSVQAKISIEKLHEIIGHEIFDVDGEYETVGGLIMACLNRVPKEGELIKHISGVEIEILSAEPRKIRAVLLRI